MALHRFQPQALPPLEVLTVVGQQREIVLQCRGGDEEIKITDHETGSAQAARVRGRTAWWSPRQGRGG